MKTLLIAPRFNQNNLIAAEVQRIANILQPSLFLINEITIEHLIDALSHPWDYIHFATHANADGLLLSNSHIPRPQLTQLLRRAKPRCIFLNTCSSLEIAIELHEILPDCVIIATILEIEDLEAYITGVLFAQAVALGLDFVTAYETSRPSVNRKYIMLNGSARFNTDSELEDQKRLILQTWTELQRRIDDSDQIALRTLDALRRLSQDLTNLNHRLTSLNQQTTDRQRRLILYQTLLLLFIFLLFIFLLFLAAFFLC